MDDIVERLGEHPTTVCGACDIWGCGHRERCKCVCHATNQLLDDAAAEIERLRTENAAMRRQALQNMIEISETAGMYNLD